MNAIGLHSFILPKGLKRFHCVNICIYIYKHTGFNKCVRPPVQKHFRNLKTLFNLKSCFYILELAHWKSEVRLIR